MLSLGAESFAFHFAIQKCKSEIHRTIIVPIVSYGCETWSLTLKEERRLRVLRRIFWPKRKEVTWEWRKLHNEELNSLYSSSNIIRVIKSRRVRWMGNVACMGQGRSEKPNGKRALGRTRLRLEGNIKIDFQEVIWVMDYIDLAQDRGTSVLF